MSQTRKELKACTQAELLRQRRRLGIRAGVLAVLALALVATSLQREGLASVPGLAIAVATLVVAFLAFRQTRTISRELTSRKR